MYNLRIHLISLAATTEGQYVSKAVRLQDNHKALPADTTRRLTVLQCQLLRIQVNNVLPSLPGDTIFSPILMDLLVILIALEVIRLPPLQVSALNHKNKTSLEKKNNRQFCSF